MIGSPLFGPLSWPVFRAPKWGRDADPESPPPPPPRGAAPTRWAPGLAGVHAGLPLLRAARARCTTLPTGAAWLCRVSPRAAAPAGGLWRREGLGSLVPASCVGGERGATGRSPERLWEGLRIAFASALLLLSSSPEVASLPTSPPWAATGSHPPLCLLDGSSRAFRPRVHTTALCRCRCLRTLLCSVASVMRKGPPPCPSVPPIPHLAANPADSHMPPSGCGTSHCTE